jgi:hypothetical protein
MNQDDAFEYMPDLPVYRDTTMSLQIQDTQHVVNNQRLDTNLEKVENQANA